MTSVDIVVVKPVAPEVAAYVPVPDITKLWVPAAGVTIVKLHVPTAVGPEPPLTVIVGAATTIAAAPSNEYVSPAGAPLEKLDETVVVPPAVNPLIVGATSVATDPEMVEKFVAVVEDG